MAAGQELWKNREAYPKPKNIDSMQSRHFVNFKLANIIGHRTVPLHQEKSKALPLLSFTIQPLLIPDLFAF